MAHWSDSILEFNPCDAASQWLRTQPNATTAWQVCERGDWMAWIVGYLLSGEVGSKARLHLVGALVDCAALVSPSYKGRYPGGDSRVRNCIEVCFGYSRGKATLEEVNRAEIAVFVNVYLAGPDAAARDAWAAASSTANWAAAADRAAAAAASWDSAVAVAADAARVLAATAATSVAVSSQATISVPDNSAAAVSDAAEAAAAWAAAADDGIDASNAARTRVLRECADLLRRHYPTPPEV